MSRIGRTVAIATQLTVPGFSQARASRRRRTVRPYSSAGRARIRMDKDDQLYGGACMRVSYWRYLALTVPFLSTALALSPRSALAREESPRCKASTTAVIMNEMRSMPDVQVFEFRGVDANLGIKLYNELPPHGDEHGDRFYILMKPGAPLSQLIVGDSGCLQDAAAVDHGTASGIKKAIERTAAADSI